MATIKVKFRPSAFSHKEGVIYYQIIHNRNVRQLKTQYKLFAHEWDCDTGTVVTIGQSRSSYLQSVQNRIENDLRRFHQLLNSWYSNLTLITVDDIVIALRNSCREYSLRDFMIEVITQLKQIGRVRTSETYRATLSSFMHFCDGREVLLADIDSNLMLQYESYLRNKKLLKNSISFYMRNLRAVYNRAVERGLTTQRYPFKAVYTGIDKTSKRALSLKVV